MKAVIQRVTQASVQIDDAVIGSIKNGILILVGFHGEDTRDAIEWMINKVLQLRIFTDSEGKMNKSVIDIKGEILVVSQFTLYGSVKKGTRPSFIEAAKKYKKENPDAEIVLALNKKSDLLGQLKKLSGNIKVIFDSSQKVLSVCDLAVVASGTATLEAGILAKPMVVIYKSNFLSNFILSNFFLKTKFIALPNILSQEKIIFELRQSQVTGEQIYEKVILSLKNKKNISEKLGSIKQSLLVSESNKFTKAIQEIFSK